MKLGGLRRGVGATAVPHSDDRARRDARDVERFLTYRRRRGRRRLAVLLVALSLVAFVLVGLFSPIMAVRDIRVEGVSRIPTSAVTDRLGDLRGRPLALVGAHDVGPRLTDLVDVQAYDVRAEPPSTLVVEITERVRIGAVRAGSLYSEVDAAGVTLRQVPKAPADVPVLDVDRLDPQSPAFQAAAQVAFTMPPDVRATVATVHATSVDNVDLVLRDGARVRWGSSERSAEKATVLGILRRAKPHGVSVYDVTSPDTPVTRSE